MDCRHQHSCNIFLILPGQWGKILPTAKWVDVWSFAFSSSIFETEQRKQYHGWNVKEFPRPEPSKLRDNTELSSEPMQTKSTTNVSLTPKVELFPAPCQRARSYVFLLPSRAYHVASDPNKWSWDLLSVSAILDQQRGEIFVAFGNW